MRIGMFADMYTPHLSGVTNYIRLYKHQMEELGHEVFVSTFGHLSHRDDEPNVIRSRAIPWGKTGWQMGVKLSPEARELIPTLDIAHIHHPFQSGLIISRHCRAHNIPTVFTNHTRYDLYSDEYASFLPHTVRMQLLRRYLSRFMADIDLVIAPSPGIKTWLHDFGITSNAVLLSNTINTAPFLNPAHPRDRTELGFAKDSTVFCYLGRLGPEKNIPMLLDAFAKAARHDPTIALLFLGDGPIRSVVTEYAWAHSLSDRIHLTGAVAYERVPDYLAAADVFVTASISEVHPLVVMEGMAAGLPTIGVHSPGVGDIVEDGVTGFLTNNDAGEFATRMLDLTRDVDLREKLATQARETSLDYDIHIMVQKMLAHYERLAEERSA